MSSMLWPLSEPVTTRANLEAFAYGEHVEGTRSLGFRLLSPDAPRPWRLEVETLARRLQAASYPDNWPIAELFCSVLLASGQRLIAIARYGLTDHTPSRRRGGLELLGVVAPASLSMSATLSVAHWLRERRAGIDSLAVFTGLFDVVEVMAEAPVPPPVVGAALPQSIGSERFLVIPAAHGNDPDLHLGMLKQLPERTWQWLPFVPADFSLSEFAERGVTIAWTTPQAALPTQQAGSPRAAMERVSRSGFSTFVVVLLLAILGANAWYLWRIEQRLADLNAAKAPTPGDDRAIPKSAIAPRPSDLKTPSQEAILQMLYTYLHARGCIPEHRREQLLKNYERLAVNDEGLQTDSVEGRLTIGAIAELAKRKSPAQIEALIRGLAAEKKGLDERVLDLIAERVAQRLSE